ncbi:MAG: hypothetical protein IJ730_03760, partial [Alphaproteobacteria bacterium]|nr:hypothetical protein [Alphaproteobacteria bacterium]
MSNIKKLRLVYDATVLKNGFLKGGNRSGVFIVALNILKQLLKRRDIDLLLSIDPLYTEYVKSILETEFPNNIFNIESNEILSFYNKL